MGNDADEIRNWWSTSIIDMSPGKISFRGNAIENFDRKYIISTDDLDDGKRWIAYE